MILVQGRGRRWTIQQLWKTSGGSSLAKTACSLWPLRVRVCARLLMEMCLAENKHVDESSVRLRGCPPKSWHLYDPHSFGRLIRRGGAAKSGTLVAFLGMSTKLLRLVDDRQGSASFLLQDTSSAALQTDGNGLIYAGRALASTTTIIFGRTMVHARSMCMQDIAS